MAFRVEIGEKIGRYRVDALLGQGGMGAVYRAHDSELGRDVALKLVVDDHNPDLVKRIRKEARAASAFAHPNVATIFDVSEHAGRPFIVMELVEGRSLRQLVAADALTTEQKLDVMKQVARALAAAHDRGLIHRDVKPDNIVVRADGVAKLLDFGIAKSFAKAVDPSAPTEDAASLTKTGTAVGSPAYMAPEQIQNRDVDERADQFAWAVTAFEILMGELPWRNKGSAFEVAASILHDEPRSLAVEGVPPAASEVIARALSRSASARYEDMHALLEALEGGHEGGAVAETGTATRKRPLPMMPISLGLASLMGGWILLQHLKTYDAPPAPTATRVVLGLNDEQTLREQEALHRVVPKTNATLQGTAGASGRPLPATMLCPEEAAASCKDEARAWCDGQGKHLVCCATGLVARADGRCECAPGGAKSEALQKGGCSVPAGDYDAKVVRVVRQRFTDASSCYAVAASKNPQIAGSIGVRFKIDPDGKVFDAKLGQTNVPDPVFQDCVIRYFESLAFPPPPDGEITVSYPLSFGDGR